MIRDRIEKVNLEAEGSASPRLYLPSVDAALERVDITQRVDIDDVVTSPPRKRAKRQSVPTADSDTELRGLEPEMEP